MSYEVSILNRLHRNAHAATEDDLIVPAITECRAAALALLKEHDVCSKVEGVRALAAALRSQNLSLDAECVFAEAVLVPGRPAKPILVAPRELKRRSMATEEGRATLIHALAHIEFNAINLALDAIWRFPHMPADYYADWLSVAAEEALHFSLLDQHLQTLGYAYGDFSAHDTLWELAEKTAADVLARMALVPRTMEARGLDATPAVRAKILQAGDVKAADILSIILRDEVGHVEIGNRWYGWLCKERGIDPISTYQELARRYKAPILRGPFNLQARLEAGFTEAELAALPHHDHNF